MKEKMDDSFYALQAYIIHTMQVFEKTYV